jgi:GNAT superfamily N-acetyltransferase
MMQENLKRMLALVGEVFDVKSDPEQIDVDEAVIEKLKGIHPATMSEFATEDGPVAWILLIPTTYELMTEFVNGKITENQLLERTHAGDTMEALYLCSAAVLPEYRHQGLARKLTLNAIAEFRKVYRLRALYFWKFSEDGARLAKALADHLGLPLYDRGDSIVAY